MYVPQVVGPHKDPTDPSRDQQMVHIVPDRADTGDLELLSASP